MHVQGRRDLSLPSLCCPLCAEEVDLANRNNSPDISVKAMEDK